MYSFKLTDNQKTWFEANAKGYSKHINYTVEQILVVISDDSSIEFIMIGSERQILKLVITNTNVGTAMWNRLSKRDTLLWRLDADNPINFLPENMFCNIKNHLDTIAYDYSNMFIDLETNTKKTQLEEWRELLK